MNTSVKGMILALIAAGLFSFTAAMGKMAASEFHVLQILFFRQIIIFLSVLPCLRRNFPVVLKTKHPTLHGLRLLGAFLSLSLGLWSVAIMPLMTAVVLMFSYTFFVSLLACWLLKETLTVHRFIALLFGFIGVAIISNPDLNILSDVRTLVPMGAAIGAAIAIISVRKLSQEESTATLLVYQAIFIGILAGIPMAWLWKTPNLNQLIFLLSIGGIATLAQWLGIQALRLGEANVISSIKYTELVYAAILGFICFDEIPTLGTLVGTSIIISSGLYMAHGEIFMPTKSMTETPQKQT